MFFIKDFELTEVQEAKTMYEIAEKQAREQSVQKNKPRPKGIWILDYPNVPGTLD
jgi:hypothetical protein